jgi:hypothetical protein
MSRGGGHTHDNVRCAHRHCNNKKHDRLLSVYLEGITCEPPCPPTDTRAAQDRGSDGRLRYPP